MENYVGQQLGNYQLVRLLGEGGFAEVYLGEHIYLGTKATIKVMHMSLAGEDMQSFRNEGDISILLKAWHGLQMGNVLSQVVSARQCKFGTRPMGGISSPIWAIYSSKK